MNAADYIDRVLAHLPTTTPMREQIAVELQGHIDERLAHGQSLDAALAQFGDPATLAESYLAAVPLEPAPHGLRLLAKLVDFGIAIVPVVTMAGVAWLFWEEWLVRGLGLVLAIFFAGFGFLIYTVVTEWTLGQTVGKRLVGLQVVRESGGRIGLGQSVVRQLPLMLQIFWIDALSMLFTERRQRLFEMLSKTRVVRVTISTARS